MTTFMTAINNASTTLSAELSDSAVSCSVTDGDVFPTVFPFPVSIEGEICLCTNRVGNTLTLTRGAEDTTPALHTNSTPIKLWITAKYITDLNTAVNAIENAKGAVSGLASLDSSSKVVEQPSSISDFIEVSPTSTNIKVPSSKVHYDHVAATDPHSGYILHSLATAANDMLVASGVGVFIKKTLAEVKTLLAIASDIATHAGLTTGVHGVGEGTVAKTADIPSAGTTASTQAFGDSAVGGSAATWSKSDHKHAMPANPLAGFVAKVISRNCATSSGDVAYTGVGFVPTSLLVMWNMQNTLAPYTTATSFGFSNASKGALSMYTSIHIDSTISSAVLIALPSYYHYPEGQSYCTAVVKSYDADGFTLTWTQGNASSSGTFSIMVLCFP